ncbi:hypothetical protein Tco_0902299 [Tanacetum coccineum]
MRLHFIASEQCRPDEFTKIIHRRSIYFVSILFQPATFDGGGSNMSVSLCSRVYVMSILAAICFHAYQQENGNSNSNGRLDIVSKERVSVGKKDTWKLTKKLGKCLLV